MTPQALARALQEYLSDARNAIVLEDGQTLFDLSTAHHSISAERDRCLLHLWSQDRNVVRQILDLEVKNGNMALTVRRFAQARPIKLEICRDREHRPPAALKAARSAYARTLERVLRRSMPDWKLDRSRLTTTMDLERSFSPVYARGLLRRGRSVFAVLGVSGHETQAAIDASLTFGLLWLQACREREAGRSVVEGLRLFVPAGASSTLQIRLAHLNHEAAKFELFELDERDETVQSIDPSDHGNISTRLVRCPEPSRVRSRFEQAVSRVLALAPAAEVAVLSATEIAFRWHGLEFARVRAASAPGSFQVQEELIFGPPGFETRLTDENDSAFAEFVVTVIEARNNRGDRRDPLWRMYPERWLESLVFSNVAAVDARLDPTHVYSQVPAFSASDRAMIDVLTCTREGRLAVLELKADEDIHLPLQGLDYWARVLWHHARGEFQQHGYFAGIELSPRPPLLVLVAPALRVHPSVDTLLRYFSPAIEWALVGVDELWREGVSVIYRKTSAKAVAHG
ncbi:MAG TPA: hypothetical protein VFT65_19855 [Candidatus Angelobacter sp.]|nr:hypothetical protein [Candidatus Angelobacter sp.]